MECILALEEVVHQYNQVTGEDYPNSLLMGTLIRCSPPHLRQTSTTYVTRLKYVQECEGNDVVVRKDDQSVEQ